MTNYRVVSDVDGGRTTMLGAFSTPQEAIERYCRTVFHLKAPGVVHAHVEGGESTSVLVTPIFEMQVLRGPKPKRAPRKPSAASRADVRPRTPKKAATK